MKINMKCSNCITCKYRLEIERRMPSHGGFILTWLIACLAPHEIQSQCSD